MAVHWRVCPIRVHGDRTIRPRVGIEVVTALACVIGGCGGPTAPLPGKPFSVVATTPDTLSAPVGRSVASPPAVRVTDSTKMPIIGVPVHFAVVGAGRLTGATPMSDSNGVARVGSWTLDTIAGPNELTATVSSLSPVTFTAAGLPGPVASLTVAKGDSQSAGAGHAVSVAPEVRVWDAYENPVPGATARFAVATGGGRVTGGDAVADAHGLATVGAWTLGTLGLNTLRATVSRAAGGTGAVSATFAAMALAPGVPARITTVAGDGEVGLPSDPVNDPPTVIVRDVTGAPVMGVPVTFATSDGGGTVGTGSVATDGGGFATTSWVLGPKPGTNALSVKAAGSWIEGNPVVFRASGIVASYTVTLRYLFATSSLVHTAFDAAVQRWQAAIIEDEPDVHVSTQPNHCGPQSPGIDEDVDDILILASVQPIDGPYGIVAEAGPCAVRAVDTLPAVGAMIIDSADVTMLENAGELATVIEHEMGHVLGFGTIWGEKGVLSGSADSAVHFIGPFAVAAYHEIGGTEPTVPIEMGTGHWRESVFTDELMTPLLNLGSNPRSIVTIASMRDLGYVVEDAAADSFSLAGPAPPLQSATHAMPRDAILRMPIHVIDRRGRTVRVFLPRR